MNTQNTYIETLIELSIKNKYLNWGIEIIKNAKMRTGTIEGQLHHIIPRSFGLGGLQDPDNLVMLTYREHFIVHRLLPKHVKSTKHKFKMLTAINALSVGLIRNTKLPSNPYGARRYAYIVKYLTDQKAFDNVSGTTWVNRDEDCRRIPKRDIDQYVADGWKIGRKTFKRKSAITINKDGVTKRVDPLLKEQYLAQGWIHGEPPTDKIRVTNGVKNIDVLPDQIPDGFWKGSYLKNSVGRVWITDGQVDRYLKSGESIPDGWSQGRANSKLKICYNNNTGKIRITDHVTQKYWPENDPIPEGWVKGSLPKPSSKTWKRKVKS